MENKSDCKKKLLTHGVSVRNIIRLIRVDYWPKNLFVAVGSVVAIFYLHHTGKEPKQFESTLLECLGALGVSILASSANYILNELCDAESDAHHPVKHRRVVASREVSKATATGLWIGTAVLTLITAALINKAVTGIIALFLISGILYNVKPFRLKDLPYLDVLAESFNNPLRLFIGWFAVTELYVPPLSLICAYWMGGAFLMAAKRLVEIKRFGLLTDIGLYRKSLKYYTEINIILQMFFYATLTSFLLGVFIARYHVELIIIIPLLAACLTGYARVAIAGDTKHEPEALYTERVLAFLLMLTFSIGAILLFVRLDSLRWILNIEDASPPPLWQLRK